MPKDVRSWISEAWKALVNSPAYSGGVAVMKAKGMEQDQKTPDIDRSERSIALAHPDKCAAVDSRR